VRGVEALALAAVCAVGCSSSSSHSCPDVPGTYELTVTPTGQSENDLGICAPGTTASVIDISIADGDASIQGQSCRVTSTGGCQIEVACDAESGGDAAVSPTFVQAATFVLPANGNASTNNALVELGPAYCGFEGTAARQP
jgi:hypothetical protein